MAPPILLAALTFLSAPLVEHDVAIRMRDGVVLRADVWRPAAAGRFPVLVYRTPYDRRHAQGPKSTVARAVERGYAVVVQDVRGRYGSEGEFEPYRNEGRGSFPVKMQSEKCSSSGANWSVLGKVFVVFFLLPIVTVIVIFSAYS